MVACYSMATAAFCQKAVVVGKVAPRSFEAASRLVAFRFQGLERKPFVDGSTNKNYPKILKAPFLMSCAHFGIAHTKDTNNNI